MKPQFDFQKAFEQLMRQGWTYDTDSISVKVGIITLPDGRKAQVCITADTDRTNW